LNCDAERKTDGDVIVTKAMDMNLLVSGVVSTASP